MGDRHANLAARRSKAIGQERHCVTRREDTRRKILVGAIVLARVDQGLLEESVLRGWLAGTVTREEDRALLGL